MWTVPWRSSSAAVQASFSDFVNTDAVSPNSVELAISSASSSESKAMIGATGPDPPRGGGPERLLERVEGHDRRHRPERLLAGDPHRVGHAREHGRVVVHAVARPPAHDLGAVFDRIGDVGA